jgi:hypothetical protein
VVYPRAPREESARAAVSSCCRVRCGAGKFFSFSKSRGFRSFASYSLHSGKCPDRTSAMCQRGDSNPHGLLHWILSPARLPVPPLRHSRSKDSNHIHQHQRSRTCTKKPPSKRTGAFSIEPKLALYFPTCKFTILGACVASASEKTRRLTYSPFFSRPSACWRSVGVLIARAGAG